MSNVTRFEKIPPVGLYELIEPQDVDRPDFRYIIPTTYAVGSFQGDCWVVDIDGNHDKFYHGAIVINGWEIKDFVKLV